MENAANLQEAVDQYTWVHSIDLGNSVVTPGQWKTSSVIMKAFDLIDFRGKSVLDIGCWDGGWSFEAERRGATTVVATDDLSQRSLKDQPTFRLAHRALESGVEYIPDLSVYDTADHLAGRKFDIILFCGVYYHLKHPLWALTQLRKLTSEGGLLVIEGPVLPRRKCFAEFLYRKVQKNDASNWFIPTPSCLLQWIECSYYDVRDWIAPTAAPHIGWLYAIKDLVRGLWGNTNTSTYRCAVISSAVIRGDPLYEFPDPDLAKVDTNDYSKAQHLSI